MPWKETCAMKERLLFVECALAREVSFAQLCREFGISRKTGYKLMKRYADDPVSGLVDGRKLRTFASKFPPEIFDKILYLKRQHPTYGASKLLAILKRRDKSILWPSESTIKTFLRSSDLTKRRRKTVSCPVKKAPLHLREITEPNQVWACDLKGWFRTGDKKICEPLTILDIDSRYLIECVITKSRGSRDYISIFERAFQTYGRPAAVRTDSGPPFGSSGLGRLSPLSVWLLKQGVYPEKIRPGHPEENSRIERFHRTLKEDTATPPADSLYLQQKRFNAYKKQYNMERPHAALGLEPPSKHYRPSKVKTVPKYRYPAGTELVQVSSKGYIKLFGKRMYLTESLAHESIGVRQIEEDIVIEFLGYPLGVVEKWSLQPDSS